MKFKRRRKNNKQLLLTQAFLLLLLFIGIGYSVLNTNLGINGTVQLSKPTCKVNNKLYNVIKCEAEENGLAAKYEGAHNDTLNNTGDKDIYYYTGDVREKFNVKLGNMCFQMLRTTDTGGVKLIYNGEYDETNKCNDSRGTHKGVVGTYGSTQNLASSYMYGDTYSYDLTSGNFTLQNTITSTWSASTADNLIGKYTCKTTTNTCTTLYGVNGYSNATTAYTTSYTIGDTAYSQIGETPFNANRYSPAMVGYMFNKVYNYKSGSPASGTVYGSDVTYANGTYTLTNTSTTRDNTHHYSCNNTIGTCTNVRFIYYLNGSTEYYIELTGGTKIEIAVNEMLYNDNVNRYNSSIKGVIDAWYRQNMTSYTSKLEDVVYCNDRTQTNSDTNGWNKNGTISTYMQFKNYTLNNDLSCSNTTDKFTTTNTKAKLSYPVGLITSPEMYLLNNSNARKTGQYYWLGSPYSFSDFYAVERDVGTMGDMFSYYVYFTIGSRPAVSLAPGVEFSSGTGTMNDPYVIKLD